MRYRRAWLRTGLCLAAAIVPAARGQSLPPQAKPAFEAGAAKRLITPDPLLPISGGMGIPTPAKSREGELTVRALALRAGGETVAIASVDLLGFPAVLGDRARKLAPRLQPGSILVGATHTHSAPDCYAFPDGNGGHTGSLEYMQFVSEQVAGAINDALDRLKPAELRTASGEAKGRIAYNYYAPDLFDRRAAILQVKGLDGRTIATLVNYAVHPEVMGAAQGILSPDLAGPLYDRIEEAAGGIALFLNGAQGGMVTADNRNLDQPPRDAARAYWNDRRTWSECRRIGRLLADESLRILEAAVWQKSPALRNFSMEVRFPVESPEMLQVIQLSPLKYPLRADRTIGTQVNLIQIGGAQILTIPGEALPNIGFYLKRRMQGEPNFLFGLTNDAFGYILTKVDFNSFPAYRYISRTSLGEMTGEIYIQHALELIQKSGQMRMLLWAAILSPLMAQPLRIAPFAQEVRIAHETGDTRAVAIADDGKIWSAGPGGLRFFDGASWTRLPGVDSAEAVASGGGAVWFISHGGLWKVGAGSAERIAELPAPSVHLAAGDRVLVSTGLGLFVLTGRRLEADAGLAAFDRDIRQSALARDGRIAAAGAGGLYLKSANGKWQRVFPKSGNRSWAPDDVRGVAFDSEDHLWFASAQGAGCLERSGWSLYTGADGLPYDDFTLATAGERGAVWFGTRAGAIRYDGKSWEYRQGLRWLASDEVRSIAVGANGDAWIATAGGVSQIARQPYTLAEKARFFEAEIDRRHRRTPYGYVLEVQLPRAGDTSAWVQHDSDNDGLWTAMYGAGECFAAGSGSADGRRRAMAAFEALRFLSTVTQGGPHGAPRGFAARTVLPASSPDPNLRDGPERDRVMRETRDALWKSIEPRWPLSADGGWYWKSDTSSDELDGHYFFYGLYYDLVAQSDAEKSAVRAHVAAITDHLIEHNFQLVDHDGKPTRWAVFNPENLNYNLDWWRERGTNSLSILAYLKVAEHITGDAKYRAAYLKLVDQQAYASNVLIPKTNAGPGSGNQSDDEMIFMNYYILLRYEQDESLRRRYLLAFHNHWRMEQPELNPLFNFLYAAAGSGEKIIDAFATRDLSPAGDWLEDSADTLRRFPIDRIDWGYRNSHRKDIVPVPAWTDGVTAGRGYRGNGKVLPIDERFVQHWNHDPWRLDSPAAGRSLADGAAYLLPYYMAIHHRFIQE